MAQPVIEVEGLSKRYRIAQRDRYVALRDVLSRSLDAPLRRLRGSPEASGAAQDEFIWALKDASFEVLAGEVMGIIGHNGAGKSTLLKILSRITKPTQGSAKVWGNVGSLLEVGTGFHPELTGRENVYLNGSILGMTKRDITRRFDDIVAFAETEAFIDTPVKRYSTGMQVRLAFAVAAHFEPDVLMIDEVLAVGDAAFQKKCLGRMQGVAREGRTVLFVSHNMHAVASLCDSALWLDRGQIRSRGPAAEQVAAYTSSVLTMTSEKPSVQDGHLVAIRNVRLKDADGNDADYFDPLSDFAVEFNVSQQELRKPVRFVIRIRSAEDNAVVLTTTSWDSPSAAQRLEAGEFKLRCLIPGNLFNTGTYSLSVGADEPRGPVHARLEDVRRFAIVSEMPHGEGVYGERDGYLSPYREWQMTPLTGSDAGRV